MRAGHTSADQGCLRNWQLQGSEDGSPDSWTVLSDHVDDCTLPNQDYYDRNSNKECLSGHMTVACFDIPEGKQGVQSRFLRIFGTGPSSVMPWLQGTDELGGSKGGRCRSEPELYHVSCAGIEFWGTLTQS